MILATVKKMGSPALAIFGVLNPRESMCSRCIRRTAKRARSPVTGTKTSMGDDPRSTVCQFPARKNAGMTVRSATALRSPPWVMRAELIKNKDPASMSATAGAANDVALFSTPDWNNGMASCHSQKAKKPITTVTSDSRSSFVAIVFIIGTVSIRLPIHPTAGWARKPIEKRQPVGCRWIRREI